MVEAVRTFSTVVKHLAGQQYRDWWKKFELLGQVSDMKNKTRVRRSSTVENIAAVAESIGKSTGLPITRRFLEIYIPQTSLRRIIIKICALRLMQLR